jgi:hypothetical protein
VSPCARHRREVRDREHRYDREVVSAVWKYEQAKAGRGYRFVAPRLREAKA